MTNKISFPTQRLETEQNKPVERALNNIIAYNDGELGGPFPHCTKFDTLTWLDKIRMF